MAQVFAGHALWGIIKVRHKVAAVGMAATHGVVHRIMHHIHPSFLCFGT
jgi:hypothetical protein